MYNQPNDCTELSNTIIYLKWFFKKYSSKEIPVKKNFLPLFLISCLFIPSAFAEKVSTPLDEKSLIELATQGQAEAQFNLAMFYQSHGLLDDALKWYLLSANQGFSKAQINLALIYQEGSGVPKDEKLMLHWMQLAAENDDPIGQMNMAEYTLYGIDNLLEKNPESAEKWLKKAAEQHFQPAMLTLAYWYEEGKAVTKDPQKAQKIYLALAEQNHPQALYLLGYQAATGMYDKVDYALAFDYFTRAAELGFSPAQNSLGMLYLTGQGTKKNTQSAIKWLTLAAKQGEVSAQFNLALIYARGDGIKADQEKACHWFIKAAQQNSADAQYASGACYQYGMGVEQDDIKALRWYKLAAAKGNERAEKKVLILENNLKNKK